MSRIKIETITPVHIGSGNTLKNNNDFVVDKSNIYIIDPAKILQLIGEENLGSWVSIIERGGSQKEYIEKKTGATPDKYSLRKIESFCDIKGGDTLKETIHNGMGLPYIPGSSIKGAIRTAILATLASREQGLEVLVKDHKGNVSSKQVEEKFFGGSPNEDLFRFLQVGDAYFKEGSEVALRMVMGLNITHSDDLQTNEKPQIVEAIDERKEAEFSIKISTTNYEKVRAYGNIGELPQEMKTLENLFNTINNHSERLVKKEIKIWKDISNEGYVGAEDYIETMDGILSIIEKCHKNKGKECILRIGHASGWRFITGAWAEKLYNFEKDIVPKSRPKNENYKEYQFPKSRRIDEEGFLLGFVKLSLIE